MTDEINDPQHPKVARRRPDLGRLLMSYTACRDAIHKFFGYTHQYRHIPISDDTACWWHLTERQNGKGTVIFGRKSVREDFEAGDYYRNEVYMRLDREKGIYRTATHTMICVDMPCDDNVLLMIFDDAKRVTDPELVKFLEEH